MLPGNTDEHRKELAERLEPCEKKFARSSEAAGAHISLHTPLGEREF
jgi:hypothetical protein